MKKLKNFFEKLQESMTPMTRNIIVGLFLLLVLSFSGGLYFFNKANTDPQKVAKADLARTISEVGKLMVLPTDEVPTLATVSDPSKLKDQPFFANAKSGDKVLIYSNARKAILYSPALNKIVEVAPVNLNANQVQPAK